MKKFPEPLTIKGKNNTKPPRQRLEDTIQAKLMTRCRQAEHRYPDFFWVYSYPAGTTLGYSKTEGGKTFSPQAMRVKAMGQKKSLPDVIIDVSREGYRKGWVELKRPKEKPSKEQLAMHSRLRDKGDWVEWADNLEDAWGYVCEYLKVPTHCYIPTAEDLPVVEGWEGLGHG